MNTLTAWSFKGFYIDTGKLLDESDGTIKAKLE